MGEWNVGQLVREERGDGAVLIGFSTYSGTVTAASERAIGVIYRPESERVSHYFEARLPDQFDAVVHFDVTRAVEPLDPSAGWHLEELPETFPTGL